MDTWDYCLLVEEAVERAFEAGQLVRPADMYRARAARRRAERGDERGALQLASFLAKYYRNFMRPDNQ